MLSFFFRVRFSAFYARDGNICKNARYLKDNTYLYPQTEKILSIHK